MASTVTIQNRQRTRRINLALLRRVTLHLLNQELALPSAQLSVCLVGDAAMTQLNEGYLRHEGSTDVITFNYSELGTPNAKLGTRNSELGTVSIHGEIFICVDEAIRQAKRFQTSWQSEVLRYSVHGVLHLVGHDDKLAQARQKMKREENRLVSILAKAFPISKLARPPV
jgi:rRNA maturation RNase YbeY